MIKLQTPTVVCLWFWKKKKSKQLFYSTFGKAACLSLKNIADTNPYCRHPLKLLKFITVKLRSSCPEVFLGKGVLKICCKFTGEYSCGSAISIKLLCTSVWLFSCKFPAYFQNTFFLEHFWTAASENVWLFNGTRTS